MPTRFPCAAVLFDLDGVLVHSAAAVRRSWRAWALAHGLDPDAVQAATHGRRTVDTIREVAPYLDAESAAADLEAAQALDTAGLSAGAGARRLAARLVAGEWGVVTSGTRRLALARLRAAGLPEPGVLVAGDDVARGKPSPEGYLLAAGRLNQPPARCLVVEDAPAGVTAGRAAGMRVLGMTNGGDPAPLARADALVRSCAQLRVRRSRTAGLVLEVAEVASGSRVVEMTGEGWAGRPDM